MKFSGLVQLCKSNFWEGPHINQLIGYGTGPKTACFYKIHLLPEFLYYRGVTYLFVNLRTRTRKIREPNFEFLDQA